MRIHILRHVPFENEAAIGDWAREQGHEIKATDLFSHATPPPDDTFDWLVVMGGPMGVHDHDRHPWLQAEIQTIREAIHKGRIVLGICLGAQLIATALDAPVTRNSLPEIGWFPVNLDPDARNHHLFEELPESFTAFHWHGDTFALPKGATPLGSSQACACQGFAFGDRVLGLQFHLESTPASVEALLHHCAHEIVPGPFVQTADTMREGLKNIQTMRPVLATLLGALANTFQE